MVRSLLGSAALAALSLSACAQDTVAPADRAATEKIVREYILANPEIIEDALIALNEQRKAEEEAGARIAVADNADLLFNASSDFSIGPDDAPVTVVEFFDYRCGPCRASMTTINALPAKYQDQVRVVFKEFPILSEESQVAAIAALAAGRQGKYTEMHQAFMKSSSRFTEADIVKIAEGLDLDMGQWRTDRADPALLAQITETRLLAQTVGANATPTFVIGDTLFSGLNRERLDSLITAEIAKAG
ncbi:MAG: thioredoxin domain-containing protein [Hyphomonadaceae bacterium]